MRRGFTKGPRWTVAIPRSAGTPAWRTALLHPCALVLLGCVVAGFVGCGSPGPQTSGSKTNWFAPCDTDRVCGEEGSCICGFCTLPCAAEADCPTGACGSDLASATVCAQAGASRVCLPTEEAPDQVEAPLGACSEVSLAVDPDLGEARTPSCSFDGALVCEGYDAPIEPEHSVWIEGDITAELQDCVVRSGAGAAHYSASGSAGEAFSQTRYRLPQSLGSGSVWLRLFVYLPSTVALPEQIVLAELWNETPSFSTDRITLQVRQDGTPSAYVGVSDATLSSPASWALPRDEWACLEMSVALDAATGSLTLALNDESPVQQEGLPTLGAGPLSIAVASALFLDSAAPAEIYIDDFAVATAPIGCD